MTFFTLIYVSVSVASLLPWTYVVKLYSDRIGVKEIVYEISEVSRRIKKTPPEKEKKLRILKSKYNRLRKKVSRLFMFNLMSLWIGIFISFVASRYAVINIAKAMHTSPLPPSPLQLPGISINGHLNDLVIYLAVLLAYQNIHNRLTGVSLFSSLQ